MSDAPKPPQTVNEATTQWSAASTQAYLAALVGLVVFLIQTYLHTDVPSAVQNYGVTLLYPFVHYFVVRATRAS